MTKYIFVTGGVVSSLGKGIAAASIGALLEAAGYKISFLKLDPYINLDPGTMSPYQHGEVFVTQDGAETDLDLGHYERFVNTTCKKENNITAGQVYAEVIRKERKGDYLGATVQVIPHITDQIKHYIRHSASTVDVCIVEVGGTVGDIESLPFLEAIRQMRMDVGKERSLFVHLTLLPFLSCAGEAKTKPTQHSVKELRSIGIQPDILMCRSEQAMLEKDRDKLSLYSNIDKSAVISIVDLDNIYKIPRWLKEQGVAELIVAALNLRPHQPDLSVWNDIIAKQQQAITSIKVAMVGKYTNLTDSYKSVNEALRHGGIYAKAKVEIDYIEAEQLEKHGVALLANADAILVPGGFGDRGVEGKIIAAKYARENNIPYFGICLGMQVAVIDFARHVANRNDANSTEFNPDSKYPIVALITEWKDDTGIIKTRNSADDLGGTMRLGGQEATVAANTLTANIYGVSNINERHRHRYEVNENLIAELEQKGLVISARSKADDLVEIIEVPQHPWFIGCQFHPEFNSAPRKGHPLFISFVKAAIANKKDKDRK